MEDSIPRRKAHFPNSGQNPAVIQPKPIRQGKSCLEFLCKALFFVLFVMVVPLFPSQAPDFIQDTIFTKFWELIHLLFIGIAVSYGLFSRRNVEIGFENHPNVQNVESYMPRMFDGCDNACGSDEEKVIGSWNAQNFVGNPVRMSSHKSTVFDAQCKPRLSNYGDGIGNSCGFKEKNVTQAWNSQYFQGESMVFVAQPNCGIDELGRPRSVVDDKPLGLPIRSLKSRVRNQGKSEFVSRNESGFGSKASSNSFDRSSNGKFGDLAPINLIEKFNAAMASSSPTLQRLSSQKLETGKKVGGANCPSHFRPLSVDEAQFESLKTRSFRSTLSFSSQSSSISSSPEKVSSIRSMSSEELSSEVVHLGKRKKSSRESSPSSLSSQPKPMNEEVSMGALHSRGYSIGSFCEKDLAKSSENYIKDVNGSGSKGVPSDSCMKEFRTVSLRSDMKPASIRKASSAGKSVRTIRGSRLISHDKVEKSQKMFDNGEAVSVMRKEITQNGGLDNVWDMPKPKLTFSKSQKEQMQDFPSIVDVGSEQESEIEAGNFEASSEDEEEEAAALCNSPNVATGPDSEVDKKAGEFIAKFREQIRLQKVASIDRSRGLRKDFR